MSEPQRRDRTRPLELLGISAVIAVFIGGFVLLGTRTWQLSLIFAGVAFVVTLVVLAMLMLVGSGPETSDQSGSDPNSEGPNSEGTDVDGTDVDESPRSAH